LGTARKTQPDPEDFLGVQLTFINKLSIVSRSIEPVSRVLVGVLGGGFGGFFLAFPGTWLSGFYRASQPKAAP
jgi:hypothetical protein